MQIIVVLFFFLPFALFGRTGPFFPSIHSFAFLVETQRQTAANALVRIHRNVNVNHLAGAENMGSWVWAFGTAHSTMSTFLCTVEVIFTLFCSYLVHLFLFTQPAGPHGLGWSVSFSVSVCVCLMLRRFILSVHFNGKAKTHAVSFSHRLLICRSTNVLGVLGVEAVHPLPVGGSKVCPLTPLSRSV